jgi:hypothetical protein
LKVFSCGSQSSKTPKSDTFLSLCHNYAAHLCAIRFAKLFISHLDEEFSKQPNESLRNLITTQAGLSSSFSPSIVDSICGII